MWAGQFHPDTSHNSPFPKLMTPYNTTEPKICQDLFVKKFTGIAGIGNLGVGEAIKIDPRRFCVGMITMGEVGRFQVFLIKVVGTRRVP